MRTAFRIVLLACVVAGTGVGSLAGQKDDPLAPWRKGVKVFPVSPKNYHSIHAYFNTSPESPDGRWVLYYASTDRAGTEGDIRVLERATGTEKVLFRNVAVEDAHRAACQQWVSGGKSVVFHNVLKSGEWLVMAVDLETGRARVLARDRMVGFGQPHASLVPLYGPHWNPGNHRDLELLDVETGEIKTTAVTAASVAQTYPDWLSRQFEGGPVSVYIPMLSPDLHKVFFKMATPLGGDFRSRQASKREGLLCYDLRNGRCLFQHDRWGHPAWHPDSNHILNVPGVVIDCATGKSEPIPNYPKLPGSHPSFSPDGRLFTSDTVAADGPARPWAVGVGDIRTGEFLTLHTFDNSRGAQSWRVSHPHPVFSPDGRRLYFNVSSGDWTQLYVAAVAADKPAAKIVYREDVVYGQVHGAGLVADVAFPESQKRLPAILSVHGGRWRGGHRRDKSAIDVKQWAGLGFFAMSIDYRLVGCTPAPACYQDLQCAIRYLHAQADKHNIDTTRIFLIGQSAGGHMVSLAATLGDGPFPRCGGWEKASNDFRAAISVAANYELTTLSWGDIWTPPGVDPIKARKLASPVHHVGKNTKPLLLLHSDNDQSVPIENALLMVDALRKADATFVFHRYPKMGHMGINDEVINRSLEFIKKQSE